MYLLCCAIRCVKSSSKYHPCTEEGGSAWCPSTCRAVLHCTVLCIVSHCTVLCCVLCRTVLCAVPCRTEYCTVLSAVLCSAVLCWRTVYCVLHCIVLCYVPYTAWSVCCRAVYRLMLRYAVRCCDRLFHSWPAIMSYAVLCYSVLYCPMSCCAMLCCAVLSYVMLYRIVWYRAVCMYFELIYSQPSMFHFPLKMRVVHDILEWETPCTSYHITSYRTAAAQGAVLCCTWLPIWIFKTISLYSFVYCVPFRAVCCVVQGMCLRGGVLEQGHGPRL